MLCDWSRKTVELWYIRLPFLPSTLRLKLICLEPLISQMHSNATSLSLLHSSVVQREHLLTTHLGENKQGKYQ